jgi:hypothetical protein
LHGVAYRMAQNAKRAAARWRKHEAIVGPRQPSAPAPGWIRICCQMLRSMWSKHAR